MLKSLFIIIFFSSFSYAANPECWSGPGEKYGSLGSFLDVCPATLEGDLGNWQSSAFINSLEFKCRIDSSIYLGQMSLTAVNGRVFLEGAEVGSVTKDQLVFDFHEVTRTNRVTLIRQNQNLSMKVEVLGGVGLIYSYGGLLSRCHH